MKRTIFLLAALFLAATLSYSQELPHPEAVSPSSMGLSAASPEVAALVAEDPDRAGVNIHVYEFDPIVDTKPPKGYKPFYISHYGRHGTRAGGSDKDFVYVVERMEKADSLGILTDEGKALLEEARAVRDAFDGREGRLTPRGEREHKMLAERMYKRYPGVFKKGSKNIRIFASKVPRCLVSMASFVSKLSALRPDLNFTIQSDDKVQPLLTNDCSKDHRREASRMTRKINHAPVDTVTILSRLFTDPEKGREVVEYVGRFQRRICSTASFARNFDIESDIFRHIPPEVVYNYFDYHNRHIYLTQCNSEEFGDIRMPRVKPLVDEIVRLADDAIESGEVAADLRFGHDWPYMAIVSYLGLEGAGDRISANEISKKWFGPKYICLACNLQMIFYRNNKGSVLVKFLVNEKETLLRGLEPVEGPYYDWNLVKENLEGWRR
ncbi:MAG: histidine-type phosphatase [Bacteroidales bacterium]|nr:histidine-type phosphatase [Bacteroidales bacterium]